MSATINYASYASVADQKKQPSASLLKLAKNFVNKVAPVYENESFNSSTEMGDLAKLEDGTSLLFVPMVDRLQFTGDVYAIKKDGAIYVLLRDFFDVLELPVVFDESGRKGKGWFLREGWDIDIDLDNALVTSKGVQYSVSQDDIYDDGAHVFVKSDSLSQWLDMALDFDVTYQYMYVKSDYPLPAVARNQRRTRHDRGQVGLAKAELPRLPAERKLFDITASDINSSLRYNRVKGHAGEFSDATNIRTDGQALYHDSYSLISADTTEGIRNVRARLSRTSEDDNLLGPLKARYYEMGDVTGATVPLTGGGAQGLGFMVNNNPLANANFNTTDIQGDYYPGWDVELYRNDVRIGTQFIGTDGRYNFKDISLFAGDNDFELTFYGPQGEVRRETLSMPVTSELLKTQKGTYEFSVQADNTDTYTKERLNIDDRGRLDVAARYNTQILGGVLGTVGVRSHHIENERRHYLSTGLTTTYGGVLYNANLATDHHGNLASEVGARSTVLGWNLGLNASVNDKEYVTEYTTTPTTKRIGAIAQRELGRTGPIRSNIFASSTYSENSVGSTYFENELGIGAHYQNFSVSNVINHERDRGTVFPRETVRNAFSLRGGYGRTSVRAGFDYDFLPHSQLSRYYAHINRYQNAQLGGDLMLERNIIDRFSRARLNVNYTNDYYRVSPFIEYDTYKRLYTGLTVNFSLYDNPEGVWPRATSDNIAGRGMVTGFVYHDKNGNMRFDEGDEPLNNVALQSLTTRKRAMTDENGYAVLTGLQVYYATDIVVDNDTLPDSYMVAGYEGNSILPTAGQNPQISYPVHISGEVDGTLYLVNADGQAKPFANKIMQLIPLDNPSRKAIETQAMFDGFFLFSKVPPGRYLMVPKQQFMPDDQNPIPQIVDIGFDGTVLAGQDVMIRSGAGFVPYSVEYEGKKMDRKALSYDYRLDVGAEGKTKLGSLLDALLMKKYAMPSLQNLQLVSKDEKGNAVYAGNMQELHDACEALRENKIQCRIRVLVQSTQTASND